MITLTSLSGQRVAVDNEFLERLDALPGVNYLDSDGDDWIVRGRLADLIEFLLDEGVV